MTSTLRKRDAAAALGAPAVDTSRSPPDYIGAPILIRQPAFWDGTFMRAVPRELLAMVLDFVWDRGRAGRAIHVQSLDVDCATSDERVIRRDACTLDMLAAFDEAWQALRPSRDYGVRLWMVDRARLHNLGPIGAAIAGLLESPDHQWLPFVAARTLQGGRFTREQLSMMYTYESDMQAVLGRAERSRVERAAKRQRPSDD